MHIKDKSLEVVYSPQIYASYERLADRLPWRVFVYGGHCL